MSGRSVTYRDGETGLGGWMVEPAGEGRVPGALVVHGGAGLDAHAKERARRLAGLGLVAFACDMYGEGVAGNRERVISTITELRADPSRLCRRAWAAVEVLASHPRVNGKIAAVGYCFGGMTVLELARSGADLRGVISVHGSLESGRPAAPGQIKASVLVCHGALDPHVPIAHVTRFIDEMNAAEADWQLIVYGGAMHGFTHDTGPASPGVAHHAVSDARSMLAIEQFLTEVVGPLGSATAA